MTTRHTHPAPFSACRCYVCPTCGAYFPVGGWQREYDYADHRAAHAYWRSVRAGAVAAATWPLLLAVGLYAALPAWWARWWHWTLAAGCWLAAFLAAWLAGVR